MIALRNLKELPVREYDKLSPTPSSSVTAKSSTSTVDTITTTSDKMCSPKATNENGQSTNGECSTSKTKKDITVDDPLILRIGSLDKNARRLSSLSINRDTSDKIKAKIKVRTKTDPHPISSSQKLRDFPSSDTVSTVFTSTHTASKCNCSSCKSMSSSVLNSDNHNKTKSVGTQHDANNAFDPWVRQNSSSQTDAKTTAAKTNNGSKSMVLSKNSNAKVIVITDDFKKKALNQEIFVDTKRKMLRYMKANKLTNSSRSMDDDNNESNEPAKLDKQKAISKSVDNVSQLSTELDQLDNVGSVELIFISDEFLNRVSKPDVIILVWLHSVLFGYILILFTFLTWTII